MVHSFFLSVPEVIGEDVSDRVELVLVADVTIVGG